MNASLLPPAPTTIKQWLHTATAQLRDAGITSARLDALILLEDELATDRAWTLAHDDEIIVAEKLIILNKKVAQRAKRVPLAYIRGFIEFYGRRFIVTPDVLIPRPETEEMIEMALSLTLPDSAKVVDIGTGSGAIAATLALERRMWQLTATDIDNKALAVAQQNVHTLGADITIMQADLLDDPSLRNLHLIVANLPYVAQGFEVTPEAHTEPDLALYADNDGYDLIERLLPQAALVLLPGGYLLLESDPWQQGRIIAKAAPHGLQVIEQRRFHLLLQLTDQVRQG